MTVAELLPLFKKNLLHLYEEDEVKELFFITIKEVLNYSKSDFYLKKNDSISDELNLKLNGILCSLIDGLPIQYVFQKTQFYGFSFKVNSSVLIPRPETEELVEWIIEKIKSFELRVANSKVDNRQSTIKNILDIGTGSGCIAISLKKHLPTAKVTAVDISIDSLTTAKENAALNKVEIDFVQDDILNSKFLFKQNTFDVIVSNPPYVKENERDQMHQNVLAHEPHHALFVGNENPLIFYDAIADYALIHLKKDGFLFFEINEYLGAQTVDLLARKNFTAIELRKDMQGKDRMICAQLAL